MVQDSGKTDQARLLACEGQCQEEMCPLFAANYLSGEAAWWQREANSHFYFLYLDNRWNLITPLPF